MKKYIKTKVKTFNSMINTLFSGYKIPKEKNHYICISTIYIDSVLKKDKKNYPQTYLEQRKYKIKKRELTNFINDEIYLSSDNPSWQILVPSMSRGRPPPTSPGRPLNILFDHPRDVPN